ncbi:hypothetical protein RCG23_13355 [Neobacillus sp. PS3-34]|uniref:hypothetical protein n=1 Tax=Neobacillus sp. PS3-34 TaxID=3070678 RepID=UPI0027E06D85|nr:hypothetical protein [Neobacillus sp. PS3-34]WML46638.1 hypothetical protein RCG23_13355 [Neobacillus sp. PS3-34]
MKKENILGTVLVSIIIFRYYVDLSFMFQSKSIAFLIGGILLIGLGIWFEKSRKKGDRKDGK